MESKTKLERQKEYNKRTNFASQKKYLASSTVMISIRLFKSTDNDLIEYYSSLPNKAEYIRKLIREDMAKNNKK